MIEEIDFETYLYVSNNKFQIFVFDKNKSKNLYFFPSKRWDLELKNNITIKLSKDYVKESLELAFEFLHNNDFKDIKIIDARIKNQIILNG